MAVHEPVADRRVEVGLFAVLLVLTFVVVALFHFESSDPTLFNHGAGPVQNACGPLGALVADALYRAVGYGAWASFVGMVGVVFSLAGRLAMDRVKWAGAVLLFLATLGMLDLAFGTTASAGGRVGGLVAEAVHGAAGTTGAWLVLASLAALCLTVLWRVPWTWIASSIVRAGESVLRQLSSWWKRMRGSVKVSPDAPVLRMARALSRFEEDDENGDVFESGVGREPGVAPPDSVVDLSSTMHATSLHVAEVRLSESDGGDGRHAPFGASRSPFGAARVATPRARHDAPSEPTTTEHARIFAASPTPAVPRPRPPTPELAELARNVDAVRARPAPSTPAHAPASLRFDPEAFGQPRQPAVPRSVTTAPLPPPVRPQASQYPRPGEPNGAETAPMAGETPPAASSRHVGPPADLGGRGLAWDVTPDGYSDPGASLGVEAPYRNPYQFELPRLTLLDPVPEQHRAVNDVDQLQEMAHRVESTLQSFKVLGKVTDVRVGPVVTTLEFLPDKGITVRRVASLADDLAMNLCATSVRIVAPIPGKGVVGIEIPSDERVVIYLRELLASSRFAATATEGYALPIVLGKDVEGNPLVADLARMPHLLVGGTTGSGKSVGVNGMLMSLLFRRTPEELKLLLVDPKKLEFKLYEDIPHLLHPVVVEPKRAAAALAWACREMERRYELIARWGVRSIDGYNARVDHEMQDWNASKIQRYSPSEDFDPDWTPERLPYIVIVIDELADLMLVARKEVESSIARLTQMARACGIHLIVATQRPSVDVVTGLIKSNLPTRLSFKLRSGTDSRTILDQIGAESLLGRGDSLYLPAAGDLMRVHGPLVSDAEVERVMEYLRSKGAPKYIDAITADTGDSLAFEEQEVDALYHEAVAAVRAAGKASTSLVQRHLKIGYNRAARIIDQMEMRGVVGPADGARPREVYASDLDDPPYSATE